MKKIKIISVLTLCALATACGNIKGGLTLGGGGGSVGSGSGSNSPTNANRVWQDQATSCGTTTPAQSTAMGLWTVTQISGQYTQQLTFSIQDTSTTVTATCSNQSYTRTATGTVASHFQGSKYFIDQTLSKTVGDQKLMCSISIPSGQMLYGFKGNCIQMKFNGAVHTLMHQEQ